MASAHWLVWLVIVLGGGFAVFSIYFAVRHGHLQKTAEKLSVKKFGLAEARRARVSEGIVSREDAEKVLRVVVNVLGYKNTIAEDAKEEIDKFRAHKTQCNSMIGRHKSEMRSHEEQIGIYEAQKDSFDTVIAEAKEDAELFRA